MHIGFGYGRPIIVVGWMHRNTVPNWGVRLLQAGLAFMATGVAVIAGILLFAIASIAMGRVSG